MEVPFTDKLGNKSWREADNDKEKALWRAAFACSVVDLKREVQELKRKLDRLAPGWEEDEDA